MDVYLDWICMAWDAIPNEMITKSFKDCGITNCHDGSEDDLIHCFKSYGSVPEGRSMLRDARADLEECRLAEEIDKAQDEENGYISDESLELDWNDELNAPNPDFHAF
uniref:Uncharacterized protein n=1 Tax=Ditylenchus dipsaci TaxID=166011 RepID=A0A915DR49_9BILA